MMTRSLLFVPGNQPRMLEKARSLPADAVILDLEDAVPPKEKEHARALVQRALQTGAYAPHIVVRINGLSAGNLEDDLRAAVLPGVAAVCLAKAQTSEEIRQLDQSLSDRERLRGIAPASIGLFLMIETALGVLQAYELARASQRVRGLCFGSEDLCRDLGAVRTQEGSEIAHARAHLVLAARAAGVQAIDGVYTALQDEAGLLADATWARQLGYSGKLVVHPAQIAPVHRAFTPADEEIAYAQRVLGGYAAALAAGGGVFTLDGKMVDAPIVARARETLAKAACQKPRSEYT